jgi:hypothetical protein
MLSLSVSGRAWLTPGGWTRREAIRVGAVGLGGLTLPKLLRLQDALGASPEAGSRTRGRAKSAIVLFLSGGPAHQDMWDLKPDAPEAVRGTFRPIDTNVAGILVSEHMPRMARLADKYAIVRSVHHPQADHPAAAYWMMVGSPIARPARDAGFMSRADRPHPGSALAKLLGANPAMPPFVMIPEAIQPNGPERAGQFAGFLGAEFDPYRINSDPNLPDYSPGALRPDPEVGAIRLSRRRDLLGAVDDPSARRDGPEPAQDMDAYYAKAFGLIASPAAQKAFDIRAEPEADRDRYGRHVFGQSVLLARRMVEAGVRLVHVNWVRHDGGKGGQGYDSHRDHLAWAKDQLLPPTDAAFSSLVEDLDARGLLDETLVVMLGEFGRTPKFNKNGGRDHWPHCFSVVMAGGGIKGGRVLGASDRLAAYPAADPVTPGDLTATLYHALGVDPHSPIHDQQNRPYALAEGEPLRALL